MDRIPDSTSTQPGGVDPRQAAAPPDRITQHALGTATPLTPLLYAFQAVLVLAGFGGVWLSVRGQHPYTEHIRGWAIALVVAIAVVNISADSLGDRPCGCQGRRSGPAQAAGVESDNGDGLAHRIDDHSAALPRRD